MTDKKKKSFVKGDIFKTSKAIQAEHISKINKVEKKNQFDYSGISEHDKEELEDAADIIINRTDSIKKYVMEIAENLYIGQKIFANYDKTKGKFLSWLDSMGMTTSTAYSAIARYEVYLLKTDSKEIIKNLPVKTCEMIASNKLEKKEKLELLDKLEKNELKTVNDVRTYIARNILSDDRKSSSDMDLEVLETFEDQEKLKKDLRLDKQELSELKKEEKKIQKRIKELLKVIPEKEKKLDSFKNDEIRIVN